MTSDVACPVCASENTQATGTVGHLYGSCQDCASALIKVEHEGPWQQREIERPNVDDELRDGL